jgi:predicted phosphate transport protein (TIGR00153 family)
MKSLESWLKTRRKVQSIQMTAEHAKSAIDASEHLQRCINYALEGKKAELARSFSTLQIKEREADGIKRRIIDELAKGDLPSNEREDLMRLARSIDQVIDWMNETGRILVEFDVYHMPSEVKAIIPDMIRTASRCVVSLNDCVYKLTERQFAEALTAADGVERLEEEMDALYQKGRGILGRLKDVDVGQAILLSQFFDAMESVSDRCEDVCDEVRVIVVSIAF